MHTYSAFTYTTSVHYIVLDFYIITRTHSFAGVTEQAIPVRQEGGTSSPTHKLPSSRTPTTIILDTNNSHPALDAGSSEIQTNSRLSYLSHQYVLS